MATDLTGPPNSGIQATANFTHVVGETLTKNWLFAGNDRAGETTAILYSLIASAERHGIDSQRYLTGLFARLPFTPEGEIDQFLPDVWKREDALEVRSTK